MCRPSVFPLWCINFVKAGTCSLSLLSTKSSSRQYRKSSNICSLNPERHRALSGPGLFHCLFTFNFSTFDLALLMLVQERLAYSVHAIKPEETLPTGAIMLVQGPLCKLLCHPKATSGEGLFHRQLGSTWGPVYQQPSCPGRAVGMLGPPEALVQESAFCSWRSLMCATGLCKLISLFLECSLSGIPMSLPSPATYSALLMLGTMDC